MSRGSAKPAISSHNSSGSSLASGIGGIERAFENIAFARCSEEWEQLRLLHLDRQEKQTEVNNLLKKLSELNGNVNTAFHELSGLNEKIAKLESTVRLKDHATQGQLRALLTDWEAGKIGHGVAVSQQAEAKFKAENNTLRKELERAKRETEEMKRERDEWRQSVEQQQMVMQNFENQRQDFLRIQHQEQQQQQQQSFSGFQGRPAESSERSREPAPDGSVRTNLSQKFDFEDREEKKKTHYSSTSSSSTTTKVTDVRKSVKTAASSSGSSVRTVPGSGKPQVPSATAVAGPAADANHYPESPDTPATSSVNASTISITSITSAGGTQIVGAGISSSSATGGGAPTSGNPIDQRRRRELLQSSLYRSEVSPRQGEHSSTIVREDNNRDDTSFDDDNSPNQLHETAAHVDLSSAAAPMVPADATTSQGNNNTITSSSSSYGGESLLGFEVGSRRDQNKSNSGVLVLSVQVGSLAAKAGLRQNDVLLQWGSLKLKTSEDLRQAVMTTPKDVVIVRVAAAAATAGSSDTDDGGLGPIRCLVMRVPPQVRDGGAVNRRTEHYSQ